ncbi:NF-kappa-B inhibitor epsilon-like [Rhopilema esculentum]|uniref:NF-kappa-B inhibitor epsilon-like n=1 Tax=Rhopilema esculentum TaxID=499914 RepID=UPI0031D0F6C1
MPRTPAVELSEYNWSAENARSEETVIEGTLQQPPKSSINLFKQDSDGDTILHLATVQQHSSVDKLIDMMKNESLDVQNKRGQTALHLAVVLKQEDNIRRLIYAGASIAVVDCHGDTPLHIACRTGKQTLVSLLLKKLLISPSVGCESAMRTRNFEGETPLHIAVAHSFGTGNEAVIHLLVSNKCDVNLIEGKSGKTCLYMALENQNYRLANYLIDRGADVNIDAFSGTSPLHLACQAGDFDMVKKLLAKNAALTAKNAEYESPKDVAATDEIRRLLDKAMKKERRRKYKEKDDLKRSSPRT